MPSRLRAQGTLMDGLKETLVSRWEFQKRFPLAALAFDHALSASQAGTLTAQLRAAGDAPDSAGAASRLWRHFALALAAEKSGPEAGAAEFALAEAAAQGNAAETYEMARILGEAGMAVRARALQALTVGILLERGYLRAPELAKLELWRARRGMAAGDFAAARQSLELAGGLDPLCPWVPWLGLEMTLREAPPWNWDLGAAWASILEIAHQLRYYDTQSLFLLNVSRALRWGLGIFAMACLAALSARYFFRVAHPLAEKLPHQVELRARYLAVALLPVSLWVGGGGFVVLGLAAVALLWKHCARSERSLLKAALTGLAVMPLVVAWENAMCRHLDARKGESLYSQAFARGYEKPLSDRIAAYHPRGGDDSLFKTLAASLQHKKQGNYLVAGQEAVEALRMGSAEPAVLVNAGNLALLSFDFPKAADFYAQAVNTAPRMTEAWFNASQAALYANKSDKHKRFLDRAAALDADWVTSFLKVNDEHFPQVPPNRRAMDAMPRPGTSWRAALSSLADLDFASIPLRTGLLELPASWILAAVLLLSLGLWFRFRRYSQNIQGWDLFECKICGKVMCRTCRKGVHCQACFKTVAGVQENRVRVELIAKLKARAAAGPRRMATIMELLFPGAGWLFLGHTGFLRPLSVALALGAGIAINGMLMEYPAFALGWLRWLAWLPAAVLYILFAIRLGLSLKRGGGSQVPVALRERQAVS